MTQQEQLEAIQEDLANSFDSFLRTPEGQAMNTTTATSKIAAEAFTRRFLAWHERTITALIQEAREGSVNRFEVIDHTSKGEGRAFVKWVDADFEVKLDLQDNDRTLKVFLTDSGGSNNE